MMTTHLKLNDETKNQINQCLNLVKEIFGQDLLGVYLYGSSCGRLGYRSLA
jgi:streptomycin 3"-adenylyltransferase